MSHPDSPEIETLKARLAKLDADRNAVAKQLLELQAAYPPSTLHTPQPTISLLARMFERRKKGYTAIGYTISKDEPLFNSK